MLNVYTRHTTDCKHADDMRWRRCRCRKWIRGVLANGVAIRESAKTRSWERPNGARARWKPMPILLWPTP